MQLNPTHATTTHFLRSILKVYFHLCVVFQVVTFSIKVCFFFLPHLNMSNVL